MPELPEVETVRRGLERQLPGESVLAVEVLRSDSIAYPEVGQFCELLVGHRFQKLMRRGKYLLIELDRNAGLAVHLRMSGRLLLVDKKVKAGPHLRVRIKISGGRELRFEDMRVFGRLWYVPSGSQFEKIVSGLAELGVEPLEALSASDLKVALANRSQAIKSSLLDQTVIAGIGNIYADESLFEAGINPLRSARDLSLDELVRLAEKIKIVLERAIALGGSSIRDYTDSSGVNGSYQHESLVYGRAGQPCRVCATAIERIRLVGRSTHFCKQCQPARGKKRKKGF
jgi:formamidopyrimidine-DNA glycosylase